MDGHQLVDALIQEQVIRNKITICITPSFRLGITATIMPSNQTIRYYLFIQIVGCFYGRRGKIGELHFCRIAVLKIS
jgi:hypothetical protein